MSDSFQTHGMQHTRLLCTSPAPGALFKLTSIKSVMPTNLLILWRPLLLLASIFPSIRVFSSELALHIRWPKYWSFSFSISPSNIQCWYPLWLPGLISCSPTDSQESSPAPQFKSIVSVWFSLWSLRSVQNYWKNHSFTMRTFAGKVMSVLFNMLSRFAIAFLPKSKRLLISWLQSSYEFGQMDNDMYLSRWYHTE